MIALGYTPQVRYPAVAGYFYPLEREELIDMIEKLFTHPLGPGKKPVRNAPRKPSSLGFIVPHAGYIYSGPVAAHAYYQLSLEGMPETVIIIGPNHTGHGSLVAVYPGGVWATPLGEISVDAELARSIVNNSGYAELDHIAHIEEHSIEVQLPFLQYIYGNKFKLVAIALGLQTPEIAADLANAIRIAVQSHKRDVVILASSDFTHYEPHDVAMKKDMEAIEAIKTLDTRRFYETIMRLNVTCCGPGGIMTLMEYTRSKAGDKAGVELLKYATSGDVTGDKRSVVGYAAVRFYIRE